MKKENKVLLINGVKILESTNIDINDYQSSEEYPSKCVQCGNENDLLVAFTKYKVCGKCVKKNYKKAVGQKKGGK